MRLSKPILEVVRWGCEKRLEDCRLPIRGLSDPSIYRAEALGLVVVAAPGIPARRLLAATDHGREVYRARILGAKPSPVTRARFALRDIFPARMAKPLAHVVVEAGAVSKVWEEAAADALCALPHAFALHGVGLGNVELPHMRVWAHAEGVVIFLPEDDDAPGVVVSKRFIDSFEAPVGIYPWLLEHYSPPKMRRSKLPLPTRWLYYLATKGGHSVRQVHFSRDRDADEETLRRFDAVGSAVAGQPARNWT